MFKGSSVQGDTNNQVECLIILESIMKGGLSSYDCIKNCGVASFTRQSYRCMSRIECLNFFDDMMADIDATKTKQKLSS